MNDTLEFGDQLRIEGINFKGFGILPKYVMLDQDLTLEAKAIYAYFCSFAGNGNTTFPSRDKIFADLKISKDCYYKHFHMLLEQGYLSVIQSKENNKHFSKNIYTLISNPKKFQDNPPEEISKNQLHSFIRFDGLKSAGYGVIPKAAMIDPRLPLKAKGIYAYFCSLTGSGNSAFPKKSQILYNLKITDSTYYKFYGVLTSLNYIQAVQRHKDGKLQANDYFLLDNPDEAKASSRAFQIVINQNPKIKDTEHVQYPKKQDTEKQDTIKQDTIKQDTNINSININNNKYKQSINHSTNSQNKTILQISREDLTERENEKENNIKNQFMYLTNEILDFKKIPYEYCSDKELMTEIVHWMTDWDIFYPQGYKSDLEQRVYNLFNHALIEMLTTTKTMTLKNSILTYRKVVDRINELAEFNDTYVSLEEFMYPSMENYIKGSKNAEIRNPIRYMMACIWEALQTGNIGLYEQLYRDGYGL